MDQLPDFLISLESYESQTSRIARPKDDALALSRSRPNSLTRRKLRYEAYDTPQLTPKLREFKPLQGRSQDGSEVRIDLTAGLQDSATNAVSRLARLCAMFAYQMQDINYNG